MERFYEDELGKVRDAAKLEVSHLKTKIGRLEEDVEGQKELDVKNRELTASKNNEHERRTKELLEEIDELEAKVKLLEKECKSKDYEVE